MDIFDGIFVDGATNIFGTVFAYTAVDAPFLSLDFQSNNKANGTLGVILANGTFDAYAANGTLVVTEADS